MGGHAAIGGNMKRNISSAAYLSPTLLALVIAFASSVFAIDAPSSTQDIAPTGSLRAAIAVGPAASTFWATRDPASGEARGVTVELAKAAAAKLRVPLKLVEYQNSGEIAAAAMN